MALSSRVHDASTPTTDPYPTVVGQSRPEPTFGHHLRPRETAHAIRDEATHADGSANTHKIVTGTQINAQVFLCNPYSPTEYVILDTAISTSDSAG
jgi:hypothetical protein